MIKSSRQRCMSFQHGIQACLGACQPGMIKDSPKKSLGGSLPPTPTGCHSWTKNQSLGQQTITTAGRLSPPLSYTHRPYFDLECACNCSNAHNNFPKNKFCMRNLKNILAST